MNADRLLEHFERISDAADAVPRLRRFVLDLAVRGKMVSQNAHDESAAVLAEKLRSATKHDLEAMGFGRKAKQLPSVSPENEPFSLPRSWVWVAIREVTVDRGQVVPDDAFTYIDVTAIDKERGKVTGARQIAANDAPSRARKRVCAGDVIYSCVRPTLLNVAVIESDWTPAAIASTAFAVINSHGGILPRYTWTVLRSPFFVACVDLKTRGQAYPAVNDGDFAGLPFPLPPFAEQHRIVAKVDELMAVCDRLEAAQAEREARRDRLVSASLARVTNPDSDDANSAATSARFHLDHFARLTTRPEHVKQLRQTILNLAVRGRLVPQDPTEARPNIASRGRQLNQSRAGSSRAFGAPGVQKPPSSLTEPERSYPPSWLAASLDDVASILQGFAFPSETFSHDPAEGKPLIRIADIGENQTRVFVTGRFEERYIVRSGDLLLGLSGSIKCATWTGPESLLNQRIARIRALPESAVSGWIELCVRKHVERLVGETSKLTVQNVKAAQLRQIPTPLPPLAEQRRIVAKVDELMALCDQLEASLASAATDRARLLESLLHEALAPAA